MNLEALANIGEFVGGVVVILSLVYLAVQIRQSTESQRTENYARALDRLAVMQASLARESEFTQLLATAVIDSSSLTTVDRLRFNWGMYEFFGAIEFMFHAARSRALPDQVWSRWSDTLVWWVSLPGVRAWWAAHPAPFTAEFTAYVDGIVQNETSPTLDQTRWREFLTGSGAAAGAER